MHVMCVCMYVMYLWMYVCMDPQSFLGTSVHIRTHQDTSVHISAHQHISVHISTHQYTSVCVCVCVLWPWLWRWLWLWLSFVSPALFIQEMLMELRYSLSCLVCVRPVKAFACLPACLLPGIVDLPKGVCVCVCACGLPCRALACLCLPWACLCLPWLALACIGFC